MIAIEKNPLSTLSDSQLIKRLDALVQQELETTLEVIRHIIEFDRRKFYLGIGYGSLYDYCTLNLGYSESAAMRRIQTARAIINYPEIYRMLEKNELNITNVCKLTEIMNEENKDELLKEARCKSKRQMEEIVARYKPGKDVKDRVRTVFVKASPEEATNKSTSSAGKTEHICLPSPAAKQDDTSMGNWGKFPSAGGGENASATALLASGSCGIGQEQKTILKKKYKLEFAVEAACIKKINLAKAILSKKYPGGVPFGRLFEETLDAFLNKHCPQRKMKRREKRRAAATEKKNNSKESKPKA